MPDTSQAQYELHTWKSIRQEVVAVNAPLAAIIDELNPGDDCQLLKLTYQYGDVILENGQLNVPTNSPGQLRHLAHSDLPAELKEALQYNPGSSPLMLLLENTIELYIAEAQRVMSFGCHGKGGMVGLWRFLDGNFSFHTDSLWNISAGARSIFMLPKVSEKNAFNRLRKAYYLSPYSPKNYAEHWHVFKDIVNHPSFGEPWSTTVLLFTKAWQEKLDDPTWRALRLFLYEDTWDRSKFWRNKFVWDYLFLRMQSRGGLKPNPYIADTVRHLITIALGELPGHAPAIDNQLAPISRIQQAYLEIYGLKKYYPTIMLPLSFNNPAKRPVYYSLHHPTAFELTLKSSQHTTVINDLYEVSALLAKYYEQWFADQLSTQERPIRDLLQSVSFDFFHTEANTLSEIKPIHLLEKEDAAFSQVLVPCHYHRFCKNSSFVKGCVRIAKS